MTEANGEIASAVQNKSLACCYRSRLGIDQDEPLPPTLETLRRLTELHLEHILFENLSMHMSTEDASAPIVFSREELMHKFFVRKRGGCCLETNGLFAMLLRDLGFVDVHLIPCYIFAGKERGHASKRGKFRTKASHFIILVQPIDRAFKFMVDVGLGEPPIWPLEYVVGKEQSTPEGMRSRIIWDPKGKWTDGKKIERLCFILEWWKNDAWEPRLQWDSYDAPMDAGVCPRDIYTLNHFQYVAPILMHSKSTFALKSIVCKLTKDEKLSLAGRRLKSTSPRFGPDQKETIRELLTEDDVLEVLKTKFAIEFHGDEKLDYDKSSRYPINSRIWEHL